MESFHDDTEEQDILHALAHLQNQRKLQRQSKNDECQALCDKIQAKNIAEFKSQEQELLHQALKLQCQAEECQQEFQHQADELIQKYKAVLQRRRSTTSVASIFSSKKPEFNFMEEDKPVAAHLEDVVS